MKRVVFMFLLSISIYNLHAQLFDSITDVRDGQKYKIIQIGNQWWMAENLNVGTWISSDVSDQTDNSTLEKYCYYDIESYCDTYGGLYFWNEMMQYNPSDNGAIGTTQGICPAGWHLPTDKEWKTLEMYLGMSQIDADGTGSRGTDEGGKLKETGTTHWNSPNNGATNETGFTGLPGGYNYCNGCYQSIGSTGFYWTATEKDGTSGIDRELSNISTRVTRWTHIPKDEGFSVRCVKDPEPLTIELSGENTTSIGGTDGSIDLSVSGGISPYSYSWSNGATVQDIDNLTAGVYSVTVTDSRDSTIIDSIRIYDTFVDSRDGQRYKAVTIGDQVWMAENLNIGIMIDSLQLGTDNDTIEKYCYHNSEDLSDIYGSLYPWEEMMDFNPSDAGNPGTLQGVCPVGWHLSTDEEWKELEMFLGMSEGDANSINTRGTSEGGKLKEAGFIHWLEPNQGATNETGFTGLPGGYRHSDNQSFLTIYEDGMFWTSTMAPTIGPYYRRLARNESGIIRGMLSKNFGFSVRCIKNECQLISIDLYKTDVQCNGDSTGAIDLQVESTGMVSYLWSNGDTIQDISGLPEGWYKVIVTDSIGCLLSDSIEILEPVKLVLTIGNSTDVSAPGMSDGSATVTPSGGTPPYSYLWDDDLNTTDSTVTGLSADTWYHIVVTDANNCTAIDSVIVSEPGILNASITGSSNITCYGMNDGSATATAWGGTPPYDYLWDDDPVSTTAMVINLEPNRWYHVLVTDVTMQTAMDSVYLTEPDPIEVTKDYSHRICSGSQDGYISLDVSGGTPPISYHWDSGDNIPLLDDLEPGKYKVTITDANGCVAEDSTVIDSTVTYQGAEICMVTVNSLNQIMVIWEKTYDKSIASYNIHRRQSGNIYAKIKSVPFDSLSIYIDKSSIPQEQSFYYKISIVDSCGQESGLSPYHKSIHMWTAVGTNDEVTLNWNKYEGYEYTDFEIYRGTDYMQLVPIRSITSDAQSWTDQNVPSGRVYYKVSAIKEIPCIPTDKKSDLVFESAMSNLDDNGIVSMPNRKMTIEISIYPNPFNESTTIRFNNPDRNSYTLCISDLSGKVCRIMKNINTSEYVLEKGTLKEGFYFIELIGEKIFRGKIIVE